MDCWVCPGKDSARLKNITNYWQQISAPEHEQNLEIKG